MRKQLTEGDMFEKLRIMTYGSSLTKRGLLLTIILSIVFYTLYFVFSFYVPKNFIPSTTTDRLTVQALFNFVLVITLIVTSFFIQRISNKLRLIYACSIVISIFATFLYFIPFDVIVLICLFVIAIFFGTGHLAFLAHFWDLTAPEERGRVAGVNGFFSLIFYIGMYVTVAQTFDFHSAVVFGIAISLGSLVVILLKPKKALLTTKNDKIGNYWEKRTILFYLTPWTLFSLINATLAKNISFHISQQVPSSLYFFLIVLQIIAAIFGTIVGGIASDFLGRKIPLAFSLTLYGISSALAGIAHNYTLLYFVYFANGLSWGILLAMYTFVIWGDLSNKGNCAKIYAIGFIIYYLTQVVGSLPLEQILQIPLVASSLGSCLLIFISNIPIFLAPELLPSDFREKIRLKLHMNAVKKVKQLQNQG